MAFDYLNARVKAWKGQLFDKEDYEKLLTFKDLEMLFDSLKKTCYAQDLETVETRYKEHHDLKVLDEALKENLTRTLSTIWDIAEEETRKLFNAFLVPWEAFNLKTVLRGVDKHIDFELIYLQLLPTRNLDSAALKELAHQKNIEQLINLLATWGNPCARELKKAYPTYQKEHSLMPLEVAIDKFMYPSILSSTSGSDSDSEVVRGFIHDKTDLANLMTVLKLHIGGSHVLPSDCYFIDGGKRLSKAHYLRLLDLNNLKALIDELVRVIADHKWRVIMREVPLNDLVLLEEKIETHIKKELSIKAVINPLGIAVPLSYILKKYREIKNIRLIGAAKKLDMPPVETKQLLLS
jgi:V/A-type H+-transporting ATPase subunit C